MKKRRLLLVSGKPSLNGPNTQLNWLMNGLPPEELEIHLVVRSQPADQPAVNESPVTTHYLNPTGRSVNRIMDLRNLISAIDPDVIHAWGYENHLETMLASCHHTKSGKIVSLFELPPARKIIRRWFEELMWRQPIKLTASHEAIGSQLKEDGIDPAITIVPNGAARPKHVNRTQSREKLLELVGQTGNSVFLIGTVSKLAPRFRLKDLAWAIDLIGCIRDDVHLLIVGAGTGESELRRFVSKTVSGSRVHLVPPELINHSDLAGLDCYWNAQLEEPLPSVMLSVMSMEIPVISVIGAGTAEVVLPLRSGLATNYGARDEFARWTKYIIEQQDRATRLAQQGKKHVEKMFPIGKMIDGYLNLYRSTD